MKDSPRHAQPPTDRHRPKVQYLPLADFTSIRFLARRIHVHENPFRICLALAALSCFAAADVKSRVLILSGANNHDWKQTTPAIKAALEETGRFEVDVEENVIDLKPEAFAPYAVMLSNFNTFGKDAPATKEWPAETQKGVPRSHRKRPRAGDRACGQFGVLRLAGVPESRLRHLEGRHRPWRDPCEPSDLHRCGISDHPGPQAVLDPR